MDETRRQYHEVAHIFPMMSGEEFDALKADIAQHGQREPIWLHPDGSIIDGRNRHRACIDLGMQPHFRTWDGQGSLVSFVLSLNLHRRHLTSSQRAAIAVDILPMLEQEAKERYIATVGRPSKSSQKIDSISEDDHNEGKATAQAAAALGTNRQYVADAKKIAAADPDLFRQVRDGEKTVTDAKRELRRTERIERIQEISQGNAELNTHELYPIVYADPPWRYEHSKTDNRQIENHYPTMTLDEICALPVGDIATDDSVLFLWTTSPKLAESMRVIESWGHVYRTCIVWDKERIGMGYYARQQHELLLIATRGAVPVPEPSNRPNSVVRVRRDNEHSQKPQEFYELIERMYPELPKIELFARNRRDGWAVWGNQSEG